MGGSRAGRRAAATVVATVAATVAAALLGLAGCTGGGSQDPAGGGAAMGSADRAAVPGVAAPAQPPAAGAGGVERIDLAEPALIRTAEMTVRVDDVGARARLAQDYARAAGGSVAGDNRSGSGDRARADLVLKVLPGRLDGVLDQFGALGEEQQRSSATENVTEQVADVDSRVATMRASIARIRAILSRATRIGDVVAVEGELSRRVTELESLEARQRALAGQVGLATVTLHLLARELPAAAPAHRSGFLGGLQDGWSAFTRVIGVLLTVLGAVLPFLLVAVPVALVAQWAVRRSRRTSAAAPAPEAPVS
ncbi:MAG: DUF4349 domain-containing protein [Mycobacteriales bacterium]